MLSAKRGVPVAVLALLLALFVACRPQAVQPKPDTASKPDADMHTGDGETVPSTRRIRAGWVPYWDGDNGIEELSLYAESPDDVVAFAVVFTAENDAPLVLEQMDQITRQLRRVVTAPDALFLSFTNDLRQPDGSYSQKDASLLWRLLGSDESMEEHLQQILALAARYRVDGVEIDYESIGNDTALWERFCLFITRLHALCTDEGLRLRVVLGWNSVDFATFPAGPEYVVMCYNLYGAHSGPGPKADLPFLQEAFAKNKSLPAPVSIAFANGGFTWVDGVMTGSLTQREIVQLQEEKAMQPERDSGSRALFFFHEDDEGRRHEVWYADGATLDAWGQLAEEYGYHSFSLWRFGGFPAGDIPALFSSSARDQQPG